MIDFIEEVKKCPNCKETLFGIELCNRHALQTEKKCPICGHYYNAVYLEDFMEDPGYCPLCEENKLVNDTSRHKH